MFIRNAQILFETDTHTHTHARTHARTHVRTHAHTQTKQTNQHTYTHARATWTKQQQQKGMSGQIYKPKQDGT